MGQRMGGVNCLALQLSLSQESRAILGAMGCVTQGGIVKVNLGYRATITYGELAGRMEKPAASRGVGLANGRNPIPIVIPCHRVSGANGNLTGYRGELPIKEYLLALEAPQALWR